MDSDDQFWLALWKVVGAVVCVVTAFGAGCDVYTSHIEKELVLAGNDPQKVRCLFHQSSNQEALLCQSIISQRHE